MKILLAGADPASRQVIAQHFIEWGHEVVHADNGTQAREVLVANEEVASLYIDWTLQEEEGLELCRQARGLDRKPYLPIIIFISPGQKDIILKALKAGADSYVAKPIDKIFLEAQLQVIERVQKLQDELLALNATLERKVRNRTQELAIAYEQLRKTHRELVTAYEKLKKTNQEILVMDRMKEAFIDVTSHELKTPLTIIKGVFPFIKKHLGGDQAKLLKLLEMGARSSERLEKRIDRAIKFACHSQYERHLEKKTIAVKELINDIYPEVLFFIEIRNQRLEIDVPEGLPPMLIDYDKIFDAMLNLVMNAVKFTPDDGTIIISARITDDDAIQFNVKDTGIGISEEDKPYIFKEFFTSLNVSKHSSGEYEQGKRGLGLGLAIAKKFIEMHGGKIGLKSTSKKGSCFYFTIPINPKT